MAVRGLAISLSADPGGWRRGMRAARIELSETEKAVEKLRRKFRSMKEEERTQFAEKQPELFRKFSVEERARSVGLQRRQRLEQEHIARTMRELSAMEEASIPIKESVAVATTKAARANRDYLRTFNDTARMIRGGGMLVGAQIIAGAIENMSEAFLRASQSSKRGVEGLLNFIAKAAEATPIMGELARATHNMMDALEELMRDEAQKPSRAFRDFARKKRESFHARYYAADWVTEEQRKEMERSMKLQLELREISEMGATSPHHDVKELKDFAIWISDFEVKQEKYRERMRAHQELMKKKSDELKRAEEERIQLLLDGGHRAMELVERETQARTDRAKAIKDSVKTEKERHRERLSEAMELRRLGYDVDGETIRRIKGEWAAKTRTRPDRVTVLGSIEYGTRAAVEAVARAMSDRKDNPLLAEARRTNQTLKTIDQRLLVGFQLLPGIV